jgi:hypothetical protein
VTKFQTSYNIYYNKPMSAIDWTQVLEQVAGGQAPVNMVQYLQAAQIGSAPSNGDTIDIPPPAGMVWNWDDDMSDEDMDDESEMYEKARQALKKASSKKRKSPEPDTGGGAKKKKKTTAVGGRTSDPEFAKCLGRGCTGGAGGGKNTCAVCKWRMSLVMKEYGDDVESSEDDTDSSSDEDSDDDESTDEDDSDDESTDEDSE